MVKIGGVSIDVSHPLAFSQRLENGVADMKYHYIAKESFRSDEEADWFVKRFDMAGRVEKIEDMVDKVDVGFVQSCNWEKHLDQAMPFINAGKPVFIDKPVVGTVKDVKRLRELVASGAKIYGGSSLRYCQEIMEFLNKDVEERGEVMNIYCTCGLDEFNYAIHVMEGISTIAQSKAKSAKYVGASDVGGKHTENFSVVFENGVNAMFSVTHGAWYPFRATVMTTKGVHYLAIGTADLYTPMLKEIAKQISTGESALVDVESLINGTEAMLCAKKSRDQLDGAEVTIDMLDDGDGFDGYTFEKGYAAAASCIYKD